MPAAPTRSTPAAAWRTALALALGLLAAAAPAAASVTQPGKTAAAGQVAAGTQVDDGLDFSVQVASQATAPTFAVPADGGVITSWRVTGEALPADFAGPDLAALRVFRSEAGRLVLVRTEVPEADHALAAGPNEFRSRIPIAAGDLLGLETDNTPTTHTGSPAQPAAEADRVVQFERRPPELDAVGGSVPTPAAISGRRLNLEATIEPDFDGDGFGDDTQDLDDDGDGRQDTADAFPLDRSEWLDTDGDGTGDNADPDDDGDGLSDADERGRGTDPKRPDTDGDAVGDRTDNCPTTGNASQADLDGDGQGDACDPDVDGDGAPNVHDAFPRSAAESRDSDRDGTGDNADPDDDGDGVADADDRFPLDPAESSDIDLDDVGDNADPDDDNDGLDDLQEIARGTSRSDLDSDDDGLDDGREVRDSATNPAAGDSDRDGLADGLELGLRLGVADPPGAVAGTDAASFARDTHAGSTTDPRRRDTDGDRIVDGREDRDRDGRRDRRETDPRRADTDRDGVPDRRDRFPLNRRRA